MHASQVDYTNLFRSLGNFDSSADATNNTLRDRFIDRASFDAWAAAYRARLQREPGTDSERKTRMKAVNPKYILRNYLAQNAIEQAEKHRDYSEIDRLLMLLGKPFDEQPEMESYAARTAGLGATDRGELLVLINYGQAAVVTGWAYERISPRLASSVYGPLAPAVWRE